MTNSEQYKYKKVMVIDDNEIDRYVAELVMEKNLFAQKVVCIESGRDALDYLFALEGNPEEVPQLIFLDINMPEMNGFEFLIEYEKLSESIKNNCIIMMLTTSLHEEDRIKAKENKYVFKFLNKPLSKDKLDNFGVYFQSTKTNLNGSEI